MLSYIIISVVCVTVAFLTLYSGFGLGTLLMPVFALFFSLEAAVAATAVVHCANNLFKLLVVGKHADRQLVMRFGLPAIIAAMAGAFCLGWFAQFHQSYEYSIGTHVAAITPLKLIMAILIFIFALFELLPKWRDKKFDRKYLAVGGLLSGFFGGLSGHQGALRSAFLVKVGMTKETFVATNAMIACFVDIARMTAYLGLVLFSQENFLELNQWPLVVCGMIAAFIGVMIGKRYLEKVTMTMIQKLTGILLIAIAMALGFGII